MFASLKVHNLEVHTWGLIIQHRELYSISYDKHNGKEYFLKKRMYWDFPGGPGSWKVEGEVTFP